MKIDEHIAKLELDIRRAELRQAAILLANLLDEKHDEGKYVKVVARLEAAAKSFQDGPDKIRMDWLAQQEGLATQGFSFKWFSEDGETLRDAIDSEMKNPGQPKPNENANPTPN